MSVVARIIPAGARVCNVCWELEFCVCCTMRNSGKLSCVELRVRCYELSLKYTLNYTSLHFKITIKMANNQHINLE